MDATTEQPSPTGRRSKRPVALITGASEGFGRELAREIAADGFDLIAVARNEARLAELARELEAAYGVRVEVMRADLALPEEQQKTAEVVRSCAGLKVMVNNAAFSLVGEFSGLRVHTVQQMVSLNLGALCTLSHAALNNADFRRGGTLLNIGSLGGSWPLPFDATYCGTKAAIDYFTRAIAYEAARNPALDVHVQVARLGGLSTGWTDRAMGALAPGEEPNPMIARMQNDPADAARTVWQRTRRRKRVVVTDRFLNRFLAVFLGTFQRLGSYWVYTNNSQEVTRRARS